MRESQGEGAWLERHYPGFGWRYVPPNLVTGLSLSLGFLCVVEVARGAPENLQRAAWMIIWCALLDKADGFVARLLKATSEFGAQMDSFADLVTFGVCPAALVAGTWLAGLDPDASLPVLEAALVLGGCLIYLMCTTLRLARYNLTASDPDPDFFAGLATTVCGGMVASYYLSVTKYGLGEAWFDVLPIILLVLALLMISNVPLPKLRVRASRLANLIQLTAVGVGYVCGILCIWPELILGEALLLAGAGTAWGLLRGVPAAVAATEAEVGTGEDSLSSTGGSE